jgi:hypothetical protein
MRFQAQLDGSSWKVIDNEITHFIRGRGHVVHHVQWCRDELEARSVADNLNKTRGHAVNEPKCCICGSQPAAGDDEYPRCGPCWSKLADMHG